jgi:hypothetical protein
MRGVLYAGLVHVEGLHALRSEFTGTYNRSRERGCADSPRFECASLKGLGRLRMVGRGGQLALPHGMQRGLHEARSTSTAHLTGHGYCSSAAGSCFKRIHACTQA